MKVLLFLLITLFSFSPPKPNVGCLEMDIIILVDYSASVNGHEQFIADALDAFVYRFDLSENGIKISIALFNGVVYELSHLTTDKDALNYGINIIRSGNPYGNTNMVYALLNANTEIQNNGRKDVRKMIIMISDGMPQNIHYTLGITRQIKVENTDLQVCGIYIPSEGSNENTIIMMSDLYVSSSYGILVQTLEELDICF